jgi:hypothetical protein
MGLFNTTDQEDVWSYTTDDGEYMPLPKKEDFYSYTSETDREFNQEAFDEAMKEWHKQRPLNYWW